MNPILPSLAEDEAFPDPEHTRVVVGLFDSLKAHMQAMADAHAAGEIEGRFREFAAATEILEDLYEPLDQESGDDWSRQTAALYLFVIRELTRAVVENDPRPIGNAIALIEPVRLAWHALDAQARLAGLAQQAAIGARHTGWQARI